jgi:hypothetical protein
VAARATIARESTRRGLINIVVCSESQSVEENWDDAVEEGGWSWRRLCFIPWVPLSSRNRTSKNLR